MKLYCIIEKSQYTTAIKLSYFAVLLLPLDLHIHTYKLK